MVADTRTMRYCRWIAGAAAFLAIAGCGSAGDEPRKVAQAAPAGRLDLGVVGVTARIGGEAVNSAGVVVDGDRGLILTTAHGVWGATSLKVATGMAVLHGRIVARDACDDLAVLETQPRLPGLVPVRPSADASLAAGRPIVAVRRLAGLPRGGEPDLITSRVAVRTSAARRLAPGVVPEGAVRLDAPGLPAEASGAPLLGADGRLAGLAQIVEHGGRTTRAALPWETIMTRLGELEPGERAQYVGWRRHYRCSEALQAYASARHPRFRPADAQLNAPVAATRLPGTQGVDR